MRSRLRIAALVLSGTLTTVLVGSAAARALPESTTHSIFARAAGVTAYLLLVTLVITGLVLAHPRSARWRRPSVAVRIRVHVTLAIATCAFTLVHLLMWATDDDGGVGWWGALVPWGSSFRPLYVSLGVLGFYAGLLTGVTSALAGRVASRHWWPIHKVAVVALVLVWFHTLGGLDAHVLLGMYVVTGLAVGALSVSRHVATHVRHEVAELAAAPARELVTSHRR
jgi:predicted ferric reductase